MVHEITYDITQEENKQYQKAQTKDDYAFTVFTTSILLSDRCYKTSPTFKNLATTNQ